MGMGIVRGAKRQLKCGVLAALLVALGCGAQGEDFSEDIDSKEENLQPPEGWRLWSVLPNNSGSTATFADNPGVCLATPDGVVIVGRDSTSNRFRTHTNQWRLSSSPAWADFGSTVFASKPACTALDEVRSPPPTPNNQFAVLGRSTDNKFYARTGLVDTTIGDWPNDPPTQPSVKVHGHKISDDLYASGPGVTVANGQLLVVGRRSNNRIYLHRNTLSTSVTTPYSSSNWQSVLTVPNLPSPWVAAGDPVIANTVPFIGVVTLLTRATSAGSNRLYYIYWDGSVFWDGVTINAWARLPTGSVTVSSDPSIEVDLHVNQATVYFRGSSASAGSNRIFQASGVGNLWEAFGVVRPEENDAFTGAPAAVGNGNFEGQHLVVAKKSNNQFYFSTPVPF
jgi:hypothetical protein